MTHSTTIRSGVLLFAVSCLAAIPVSAQTCTNASYFGTHFYLLDGYMQITTATLVSDRQIGKIVADGLGNLTGTAIETANGIISHLTLAGTYIVNSDCSGSASITTTPQGGLAYNSSVSFQLVNGARQGLIAVTSPGYILTGEQYAAGSQCTNGQLSGPYGFVGFGSPAIASTPYASVGSVMLDAKGGFSSYNFTTNGTTGSAKFTGTGSYSIGTDCTGTASLIGGTTANMTLEETASGLVLALETDAGTVFSGTLQPILAPSILSQFAFGGGWYSALYFTNDSGIARSFTVNFFSDNGTPLSVPNGVGTSVNVTLAPLSSTIIEAPNTGALNEGYVLASLPSGVTGYGVVRQSVQGVADQEAVVPLASASATRVNLSWDDTNYTTAVAIVNPSSTATTVAIAVNDTNGKSLGTASLTLNAYSKTEATLRSLLPNPSVMAGQRGYATFSVTSGNVAVLGLRFYGSAFTSIPTTGN